MMIESHIDGKSEDILEDNINKLKELFPEIVTENKIDFDKLKNILGGEIEESSERYNFTWPGKTQAIKESQKQSTGTLRPCKEESKNWDSTQNLYIEGDNLEVLKLLQKTYYGKIKMIYIDPPYNTGKDFVYSDNYTDNLEHYLEITGQTIISEGGGEKSIKTTTNPETSGRYHSNWLNMMYPRLKLARNLLTDDGVIFISIDEHEITNLMKLANEIFFEENVEIMVWEKISGGKTAGSGKMKITKRFRKDHEYIIICYKNKSSVNFNKPLRIKKTKNEYGNKDNDPRGNWMSCEICKSEQKSNPNGKNYYTISTPSGKKITRQWHYSYDELKKLDSDNRIYWGNGDIIPRLKKFLDEPQPVTPSSLIYGLCTQTEGNNEIKELGLDFDNPKPKMLIQWFTELTTSNSDIVLDFFAGSSTTAHALMDSNNKFNKNCRFILIQIPEKIDKKSKAYKEGFTNICEIGKERIRRSGEKILEESENKDLDVGFKVFKLYKSNLEKWDTDPNNLEQTLLTSKNNIKSDRTNMDLVYEIMLKYGIDLTLPIEEYKNLYSIGAGALIICLGNNITTDIVDDIMEVKGDSEFTRVVFKDNGFNSDCDKSNIKLSLDAKGIDEFITF